MRTMLRVSMDVEAGNKAILDGTLPQILEKIFGQIKPEAAYFLPDQGRRTALVFFDLKDPSEIPQIAEPLFIGLNAAVDFTPVMNKDDLERGLSAWKQASAG